MPLHDGRDDRGWDGLFFLWQREILDGLQQRLPAGYRAFFGSLPVLTADSPAVRPNFNIWTRPAAPPTNDAYEEPDFEGLASFALDPDRAVHIDWHGQLVAAVELVSPRNKDRPESRERSTRRYFGYLHQGVHLLLIDVLPRPIGFSFADAIASEVGFDLPPCPVPCAVSFRVGEPVPEGTLLAVWQRILAVGQPLPSIPVALTVHDAVTIDLEHTYREAARRVYLD